MEEENKKKIDFKIYIIAGIIALAIGAGIFCLYFFLNKSTIIAACNASILAAVSLIGLASLILLTRFGAFDTFAYGFAQLGTAMFGRQPKKYNDMVEYKQIKAEQRKDKSNYFISFFIAGGLFLIATLVLEILYHNQLGYLSLIK